MRQNRKAIAHPNFTSRIYLASALVVMFLATPAYAYIGPGAGLSALGSVLALIGAICVTFVGFVWFPMKRFLKKRRAKANAVAAPEKSS